MESKAGIGSQESCGISAKKKAGDGIRTHDIQLGKLTLYQLSYTRIAALIVARPPPPGKHPRKAILRRPMPLPPTHPTVCWSP